MKTVSGIVIGIMVALTAGCTSRPPPPALSDDEQGRAIYNWLDCEECYNGQYEYVIYLGRQVRPRLELIVANEGDSEVLEERRRQYAERLRPRVAEILSIELERATEAERVRVDSETRRVVEFYIGGDLRRHAARARIALDNLSRSPPSGLPRREP